MNLVLGCRRSPLALAQARSVADLLIRAGAGKVDFLPIRTHGDEDAPHAQERALSGKALFTQRIEDALVEGRIDVAVHSYKDLPSASSPEVVVGAVPAREDPRDALVLRTPGSGLEALPTGARVATSSLRRAAQLRALRPDLLLAPLRGNVNTRIARLEEGAWDAVVLAVAGLRRLGLQDRIAHAFSVETVTPAPAQGALAVQTRRADREVRDLVAGIGDADARSAVDAERALADELGSDCNTPVGALALVSGGTIRLHACVADADGSTVLRETQAGPRSDPEGLARAVARRLVERGAARLLSEAMP